MAHAVAFLTRGGHGVTATSGYSVFITPWMGTKSNTLWSSRNQNGTYLSGGFLDTNLAVNDLFTNDHYLDSGTFKVSLIYHTESDAGIYNITGINGTQTVDAYSAVIVANVYSEVTGIVVTVGLKTVQMSMATKNASSSSYRGLLVSYALIRTGA